MERSAPINSEEFIGIKSPKSFRFQGKRKLSSELILDIRDVKDSIQ